MSSDTTWIRGFKQRLPGDYRHARGPLPRRVVWLKQNLQDEQDLQDEVFYRDKTPLQIHQT